MTDNDLVPKTPCYLENLDKDTYATLFQLLDSSDVSNIVCTNSKMKALTHNYLDEYDRIYKELGLSFAFKCEGEAEDKVKDAQRAEENKKIEALREKLGPDVVTSYNILKIIQKKLPREFYHAASLSSLFHALVNSNCNEFRGEISYHLNEISMNPKLAAHILINKIFSDNLPFYMKMSPAAFFLLAVIVYPIALALAIIAWPFAILICPFASADKHSPEGEGLLIFLGVVIGGAVGLALSPLLLLIGLPIFLHFHHNIPRSAQKYKPINDAENSIGDAFEETVTHPRLKNNIASNQALNSFNPQKKPDNEESLLCYAP